MREIMFKDILYLITDQGEMPLKGVADFKGIPHYFTSLFDDDSNDWSDIYMLHKIDNHSFDLALLGWAIERRFCVSKVNEDIPFFRIGALPEEKNRLANVVNHIESKVNINVYSALFVYGKFQMFDPKVNYNLAFVNWVELPKSNSLKVYYDKSAWRFKKSRYTSPVYSEGDYL